MTTKRLTSCKRLEMEDAPGRSLHGLIGVAVLAVPLLIIWWPGCRQYPPVSSRESLSLLRLLYTACNTRNEKRLSDVEAGVRKLPHEGKMTAKEKAGFERIIAMARAGKWKEAEQAAFKFARDQVGQGDDTPERYKEHHRHSS